MSGLVWSATAQRDLREIIAYYGQFGSDLPERLISAVERAAGQLIDHPRLGAALPDSDVRVWLARNTPFVLLYRPRGRTVRILKVRQATSDWKPSV